LTITQDIVKVKSVFFAIQKNKITGQKGGTWFMQKNVCVQTEEGTNQVWEKVWKKRSNLPPFNVSKKLAKTPREAKKLVGHIPSASIDTLDPGQETFLVLPGFSGLGVLLFKDPATEQVTVSKPMDTKPKRKQFN